ncbi:hypothetical protein D3C83_126470 [compost metagenome]
MAAGVERMTCAPRPNTSAPVMFAPAGPAPRISIRSPETIVPMTLLIGTMSEPAVVLPTAPLW